MRSKPHPAVADPDVSTHARRGRTTAQSLTGEDPRLRAAYALRPACWALWAAASVLDDLADQRDVEQAERQARVEA